MVLTTQLHIGNLIPRCIFYFADVNQNSPINHTERQSADDSTMSFMESSKVNILKKNTPKNLHRQIWQCNAYYPGNRLFCCCYAFVYSPNLREQTGKRSPTVIITDIFNLLRLHFHNSRKSCITHIRYKLLEHEIALKESTFICLSCTTLVTVLTQQYIQFTYLQAKAI